MKSGQIYIYTKDIMQFTGKSHRTCQTILSKIKRLYGKQRHQHITIREFADYMNIRMEDIQQMA